jgi:hypothetical protein
MCSLWGNEETLNHLFVECNFTKDIWYSILKELKLNSFWEGGQIIECFQIWIRKMDFWKEIPCYICWEIWKHKNLVIFEEHPPSLVRVCNKILQVLGENKNILSVQHDRIARPPLLDWNLAVGFFDGASQCEGSKCGAGAVLKMSRFGYFQSNDELWHWNQYQG